MEQVFPFGVLANAIKRVTGNIDCPAELELVTISGGPIFGWIGGRPDATQAAKNVVVGADVDFDIAATVNDRSRIELPAGSAQVTLFALVDSIGYLRFKERR